MSEKKKNKKQGHARSVGERPAKGPAGARGPMDVGLLQQLVELMAANDLGTVDVRDGEKRIILKRGREPVMSPMQPAAMTGPAAQAAAGPAGSPGGGGGAAGARGADEEADLKPIKSPMVGTFYSSPSPEAKAFVQVGSVVDEETDVCVIEAMKVFNNIKAETRGTIAKVMVSNGQTVEFGQTLFLVKPA